MYIYKQFYSTFDKWGRSSVVERKLCMFEAPGSIPGVSTVYFATKIGLKKVFLFIILTCLIFTKLNTFIT